MLQSDNAGDTVFFCLSDFPRRSYCCLVRHFSERFQISSANDTTSDLTVSSDGTLFALRAKDVTEIRGPDLTLITTPISAELETIPQRVAVPDVALHPSGAIVYEPFLDGPAPAAPPAQGIRGAIDIRDTHNGKLLLRVYLPEPLAMLSTDIDGLHGSFLTTDENGQRLFAVTTSGLTIIQLASVPLGIGTLSPSIGSAQATRLSRFAVVVFSRPHAPLWAKSKLVSFSKI